MKTTIKITLPKSKITDPFWRELNALGSTVIPDKKKKNNKMACRMRSKKIVKDFF